MKRQILLILLIGSAFAAFPAKADSFYQTFQKPYRQEVGLGVSAALVGSGLYKFARALPKRSPFGILASLGAMGLGSFGSLIVEGNSPKPKFYTNERFPYSANMAWKIWKFNQFPSRDQYGMPIIHPQPTPEKEWLKNSPHAAMEGFRPTLNQVAGKALEKTVTAFDYSVEKVEPMIDFAVAQYKKRK